MSHGINVLVSRFGLTPTGIIHVGANRGQEIAAYETSGVRPVVLIEPLDGPFRHLTRNVKGKPGFYAVQACCSDVVGRRVEFHVANNQGQSSSYLEPAEHTTIYPDVTFDSTIALETTTLDSLVATLASKHGLQPQLFDYLGMDTQGAEPDIIRGATHFLQNVKFVWSEITLGGLYRGDTNVYDMTSMMRELGFDLYFMYMKPNRWGEALFIRRGVVVPPALR